MTTLKGVLVQFNATAIRIEPCKEPTFNKSFFLWSLCYDYYPDRESKEYIWDYCRGTVVKLGYTKEGILQILSNLLCGLGSLIGLIEGIIYLTKSDQEFYQTYQVNKKGWF